MPAPRVPSPGRADARQADRYLLSIKKCLGVLHTDDGQTADGYIADISEQGCLFIIPAGQLRLRMRHRLIITSDDYQIGGEAVRSSVYGETVRLGIYVDDMPTEFFEHIKQLGGALRFGHESLLVINRLTAPVAFQATKLIQRSDIGVVDLQHCTGLEFAGAGFLARAAERGKRIQNVPPGIRELVKLAGISISDS